MYLAHALPNPLVRSAPRQTHARTLPAITMGCTGVAVVGFLVSLHIVCRHLGEPGRDPTEDNHAG